MRDEFQTIAAAEPPNPTTWKAATCPEVGVKKINEKVSGGETVRHVLPESSVNSWKE